VLSKLKAMASNLEERTLHERKLRKAMERSPLTYEETLREPIHRLEAGFLEERLPEITHLIEKHAHHVANFPVVLAARLEERQVQAESRSVLTPDFRMRARSWATEVRILPEAIVHPDQLVACIEFSRGVRRWTHFGGKELPHPWKLTTRRLNDLRDTALRAVYERGFEETIAGREEPTEVRATLN